MIIPIKSFAVAKGRLSDSLTAQQRHELAESCAETVIAAARPFHTYVACSDSDIDAWANRHGAHVVHCVTPGLDIAVQTARDVARNDGFTHVIVAHADLPLARTFEHVAIEGEISAVPDRHRDGTNVLAFPIDSPFTTAYGPGSFENHRLLAEQAGLPFHTVNDRNLELDLDTADDLTELSQRRNQR